MKFLKFTKQTILLTLVFFIFLPNLLSLFGINRQYCTKPYYQSPPSICNSCSCAQEGKKAFTIGFPPLICFGCYSLLWNEGEKQYILPVFWGEDILFNVVFIVTIYIISSLIILAIKKIKKIE